MESLSSCFATDPLSITELENCDSDSPQHDGDSPPSVDHKNASSSPKRKRAMHKRVVSVPIKEIESSRAKGETAPPSDSWAWRKYGQKPIKGSPYPRGYYRCSSSKGCPARKQVERSRLDPAMLVVTYTSEHNHPRPPSRNHHHSTRAAAATKEFDQDVNAEPMESKLSEPEPESKPVTNENFTELDDTADLGWFTDMDATPTTRMLDSPISTTSLSDMAMVIPMMRDEDESLFADLGELPECAFVFRSDMPLGCMTSSS